MNFRERLTANANDFDTIVSEMLQLIEDLQKSREWQPMKIAPRDDTEIIGLSKSGNTYIITYDDTFSAPWRVINEFGFSESVFECWMNIPDKGQ